VPLYSQEARDLAIPSEAGRRKRVGRCGAEEEGGKVDDSIASAYHPEV